MKGEDGQAEDSRDNKRTILSRLFAGGLRRSTEDNIRGWLSDEADADAKNEALEDTFEQMYNDSVRTDLHTLDTLNELHDQIGLPKMHYRIVKNEVLIPEYGKSAARRTPLKRRIWLRAAAVLIPAAVLAGAGVLLHTRIANPDTPAQIAYTMVEAPAGGSREITLPDGSHIRMASGTNLMYAADFEKNRSVKFTGEVFFTVTRMADDNPFTVDAGGLTITVLGTEFGVSAHADGATSEVLLLSGSVRVKSVDSDVVLAPMEALVYDRASGRSTVRQTDRIEAGVWKGTLLLLDNLPVGEALGKVAEFYGMNLVLPDGFSSDKYIRTVVHREDSIHDVMRVIHTISPDLIYSIADDTLIIANE